MCAPQPWLAEAEKLYRLGVPASRIAAKIGVERQKVYLALKPDVAAKRIARQAERKRERRRADPAYADKVRATNKRSRIRAAARQEAADTGVPVEQVYERWGVA